MPRHAPPSFSDKDYWDERFSKASAFDWLLPANSERLREACVEAIQAANNPPPRILHIGCGTSALSFQLATLVRDPATQIHNTDFSSVAIESGLRLESKLGSPRMQWSTLDLLFTQSILDLVPDHDKPPYNIIVDKSTSDAISCGDDLPVRSPYRLAPSNVQANVITSPESVHVNPLHLLAVHLAYLTSTSSRWLAVSYSPDRFPFLSATADLSEQDLEAERVGIVHPKRLWRVETKQEVDISSGADTAADKGPPVHRPKQVHYLYVLVRTDVRLEAMP